MRSIIPVRKVQKREPFVKCVSALSQQIIGVWTRNSDPIRHTDHHGYPVRHVSHKIVTTDDGRYALRIPCNNTSPIVYLYDNATEAWYGRATDLSWGGTPTPLILREELSPEHLGIRVTKYFASDVFIRLHWWGLVAALAYIETERQRWAKMKDEELVGEFQPVSYDEWSYV